MNEVDLQILGEDPSSKRPKTFQFHPGLASRWNAWIASGLEKDDRINLLKSYSREGNCSLEPPVLNPEISSSLNDASLKRDRHFVDSQCLIGSALSALGSAITMLLYDKKEVVDRDDLLRLLCDTGKLMTQLHHKESLARKAYILPNLEKKAKTVLAKTETDKFLFGENLSEKLKSARALEKTALDLKLQPPKTGSQKGPFKKVNAVNWKSPPARFQKSNQVGSNHQGPNAYKQRGRPQQENRLPEQPQTRDEKSAKERK